MPILNAIMQSKYIQNMCVYIWVKCKEIHCCSVNELGDHSAAAICNGMPATWIYRHHPKRNVYIECVGCWLLRVFALDRNQYACICAYKCMLCRCTVHVVEQNLDAPIDATRARMPKDYNAEHSFICIQHTTQLCIHMFCIPHAAADMLRLSLSRRHIEAMCDAVQIRHNYLRDWSLQQPSDPFAWLQIVKWSRPIMHAFVIGN